MASAAPSGLDFFNQDWSRVELRKEGLYKVSHDLEKSTGDLYGLSRNSDTPQKIAWKSAWMCVATPAYALGMIGVALIRMVSHVSSIAIEIIKNLPLNLRQKGHLSTLGTIFFKVAWEAPVGILKEIERIAKAPLFAVGMMCAATYALISPLEGRKWLGKIELEWHENSSYKKDFRHGRSQEEWDELPLAEMLKEAKDGKILYLGYCMQKRGNINDKQNGNPLFVRRE